MQVPAGEFSSFRRVDNLESRLKASSRFGRTIRDLVKLQSQLPKTSANAPIGECDEQEAKSSANIWILNHPDVQKSIELGFYTAHHAISATWQEQLNGPDIQQGMFADVSHTLNRRVENGGFVAPPPSIEDDSGLDEEWTGLETGSNY